MIESRRKRSGRVDLPKLIWMTLCLALLLDAEVSWGNLWGQNRKGNALYEKGEFDEALKVYKDALLKSPESPHLHYNIGNALYQKRKFKDAAEEYQKALRSDQPLIQEQTFYNLGNSAYRQDKLTDAIEFYKKALQLKPDDMDAKYNLEFVRKKLKEMAQKHQPKSQQEKSEEKQDKKQQKRSKEGQPPEEERAKQREEKESEQPQEMNEVEGEKKGQERPESSSPQKGMMSKEEAQRLLDALKEQEKKDQKELRKMKAGGQTKVEKDW